MTKQRSGLVASIAFAASVVVAACGPASTATPADPQQLYLTLVRAVAPTAAEELGDEFLIALGLELCDTDVDAAGIEQQAVETVYAEMGSFDVSQADLVQAVIAGASGLLCPAPGTGATEGASSGSGNPLPTGTLPPMGPAAETARSELVSKVRATLEGATSSSGPIVESIQRVALGEGELAAEFTLRAAYQGQATDIAYAFVTSTAGAEDFAALRDAPLISALVWRAPTHQLRVVVHDGTRTFEAVTDADTLEALAGGTLSQDAWLSRTDAAYSP